MMTTAYQPVLEVTRGGIVESIHYGAIAVVDVHGSLVASYGDPEAFTYLRSSAKPFQALPFIERGGHNTYGLTPKEIALLCASHSGTDEHVATLQSIQGKTGVREADLMCGVHPPFHKETAEALHARGEVPTPNRHNCSGKHTGMVASARLQGLTYDDYLNPQHPVQQQILQAFAEMCQYPVEKVIVGIDGCSAPNFALPLRHAAWGFARLCDPGALGQMRATACQTILTAMLANPRMVGGPDSFDTHLMQVAAGRVVAKGGAEGYLAMGLPANALRPGSPALGIALKVSDGDLAGRARLQSEYPARVRPSVALETLRQLGLFSSGDLDALADFGPAYSLGNWRKIVVGEAHPCFQLEFHP